MRASITTGAGPSGLQHAGAVGFLRQGGGAGGGGCQGPTGCCSAKATSGDKPESGTPASIMSSGVVTSVAPLFNRPFAPSACGSSGWPGTAKTSRPCSPARRAVTSVAERFCRFDDEDSQRDAGNDSIAPSGVLGAGLEARRHVGDDRAFFGDSLSEGCVLRRIDDVDAARRPRRWFRFHERLHARLRRCCGRVPRRRLNRRVRDRVRADDCGSASIAASASG